MKGTQAALAIGVGYLLGRRRKMRLAAMLAAGAATGGLGSVGGAALRRGMQLVGSTDVLGAFGPQLSELADTVRGDLIDAGKSAASAAVSSRIDALTDSLHERAELVRNPAAAAGEAGKAATSGAGVAAGGAGRAAGGAGRAASSAAGEATSRLRGRGRRAAADEDDRAPRDGQPRDEEGRDFDEGGYDEADYDEAGYDEAEAEAEEPEAEEPEAEEPEADDAEADDAEAEEPAPRRRRATTRRPPDGPDAPPTRRRAANTRRRSPVARAGR